MAAPVTARSFGVLVAVVILVGVGVSVGYHPPPASNDARAFDRTRPGADYHADGELAVDGRTVVRYTVDVVGDRRRSRLSVPNATYVTYANGSGVTYTRLDATTAAAYARYLDRIAIAEGRTVVRRDDASHTAVVVDRTPDRVRSTQPTPRIAFALSLPAAERTGTTTYRGTRVAVFRPRDGWYDESARFVDTDTVRVSGASGVLYVHGETGRLYHANVTYLVTPGDSPGSYLINRLSGRSSTTTVRFAYRGTGRNVSRPGWARRS